MKKLILTDDDVYYDPNGNCRIRTISGGMKIIYKSDLIIKLNRDGGYEVMKDRFGLSKVEIDLEINQPDERLLLMLG
jgi:hypothetical protein